MGKKHDKKHKKEKKREKKSHKKKRDTSSDDVRTPSSDEWVEKSPIQTQKEQNVESTKEKEDWMMMESTFSGKTRKELTVDKKNKDEALKDRCILDDPGQSCRELNPFWRNGGTGLPAVEQEKEDVKTKRVGDGGINWLKKGLQRAKEQAEEEGRSLDDVITERYGSLEEYNKLLKKAEGRDERTRERYDNSHHNRRDYGNRRSTDRERFRDNNSDRKHVSKKFTFQRPDDDCIISERSYKTHDTYGSSNSKKRWRKSDQQEQKQDNARIKIPEEGKMESPGGSYPIDSKIDGHLSSQQKEDEKKLTHDEMNKLSAEILKAKLMGKKDVVTELTGKLERACANKDADKGGRQVVLLTETDNRGFTRPVRSYGNRENTKKRKANTHEGQQRVRYFADDDEYSLQDLFEREKYNSTDDQNTEFLKLVAKERINDMDDEAVYDQARMDETGKDNKRKWNQSIKQHTSREKSFDTCKWCLGNKSTLNNCIVFNEKKVYLAVPPYQSLTERHCLIIPQTHLSCGTLLDEDVWNEIMDLRKKLVKILIDHEDEDVIFFETTTNLQKNHHMVLHCVPVPREVGDTAPIFFKKAIQECDTEWTDNKKVVELAGRNVRKAIPRGLPYFAVDFGMQSGYAHIIEDRRFFPQNFAQEIIGGMLDLDHNTWRKPKWESPEDIEKKRDLIKKLFEE